MKVFEFSFNPKKRKDRFFGVYSYEPKAQKERPKGSLYIIGELTNALEFNARFLKRLAETIQNEYYSSSLKTSSSALKAALKSANTFLTQENKKGNVDWLGNLHLSVLLFITIKEKKTVFHLAKTGKGKVFLVRQGALVDVGKNLEASSSRHPGKVFGNVASGNLVPNDSVLVESAEVFDVLSREKSLAELGGLYDAKQFREFFAKRSDMFSLVSGILVSFVIEEEIAKRSPVRKSLLPALPKPRIMLPKGVKLQLPKFGLKFNVSRNSSLLKRRAILIFLLTGLLLLGYLLF